MAEKAKKGLDSPFKKKEKPVSYEKNTMNFAQKENSLNIKKLLPVLLVIIIVGALFSKFGIIDQLSRKSSAYSALADKQNQFSTYSARLAANSELEKNYGRYSYGWMEENEVYAVDRMEILALIENKIMPFAQIDDFSVNNNVLTLNLSGITLDQASGIVQILEEDALVRKVSVYSATAPDAEIAKIFMSIILNGNEPEETTAQEAAK